jgi:two-component system, LytTR family, sensor kinase
MLDKFKNSFWTLQIGGWLVYAVAIYITFITVTTNYLGLFYIKTFRAVVGFFLTTVLWQIYRRLVNRLSLGKIVVIALVLSLIFGFLWALIEEGFIWLRTADYNFYNNLARFPKVALDYAMTVAGWSGVYFLIKYWQKWQVERENVLQATFLADKAQLEVLRYQLNPHFLFNALNSIRASVDEDKTRAKQMITQLSEFLRHSLLSAEKREIPLREELEAVQNYLAIEKIRFEEKLEVDYAIEKRAEDFAVPCLLLNPLVENAIKHGLQTSPKPLKIKISAEVMDDKLVLEVANTGRLDNPHESNGTKIGLKNVRERLEKLYGRNGSFELKQDNGLVKARIEISKPETLDFRF